MSRLLGRTISFQSATLSNISPLPRSAVKNRIRHVRIRNAVLSKIATEIFSMIMLLSTIRKLSFAKPNPFAPFFPVVAILVIVLAFLLQAHSFSRAVQLTILFLPGALLLLATATQLLSHRLRTIAVGIWTFIFIIDAAIRAYIINTYQAAPNSTFIVGALANTSLREGLEYARTLDTALGAHLIVGPSLLMLALGLASCGRRGGTLAPIALSVLIVLLGLSAVAYIVKPWRKLHPIAFWTNLSSSITETRANWHRYDQARFETQKLASALGAKTSDDQPSTVVLVISDSVNRDNMSLYGYDRATTPAMSRLQQTMNGNMIVFSNAWSVEASTLPSLHRIFELDNDNHVGEDPHILSVARSAGYRTWWISNHDDMGIEQEHARLARAVVLANRSPGRSGGGLDEQLLPHLSSALDDPAPRKFIVLHLMGAHPHYQLRYPKHAEAFESYDEIDQKLRAAGRSWRIGQLRKRYDSAILYNDAIIAKSLNMLREAPSLTTQEHRAWMYLSDHGQEVGHTKNFAGHSIKTSAGYRIPAIVWRNQSWPSAGQLAENPFRSDWTSWVLADLLRLEWKGKDSRYSALDSNYRWRAPITPGDVVANDQDVQPRKGSSDQ